MEVKHRTPSEMIETITELCARDCAAAVQRSPLFDCPPSDFLFEPFLEGFTPGGPEFILAPTNVDAGPLAWSLEQALGPLEL